MNFINQMRQRPEEERLAFSVMVAGAVALILFLLWGITFFKGGTGSVYVEVEDQTASVETATANLQDVINEFSGQYTQLKEVMDQAEFTEEVQGENVVEISVDRSGEVQVENVIVGPTIE